MQVLIISGLLFATVSCDDDDDEDQIDVFTATLSGADEVPPNESTATGSAELSYNRGTRVFQIVVEFSGFDPIGAHIHRGEAGVNGPVVFGFDPPTSPINYTSEPLTPEQEADLYNELYYVNVHSEEYPGGEIRGQLRQE